MKSSNNQRDTRYLYSDLAIEQRERFPGNDVEIPGVELTKEKDPDTAIEIVTVKIMNEKGAGIMKKPMGTYITLEHCDNITNDPLLQKRLVMHLTRNLHKMLPPDCKKMLVAGLGNARMTADALGHAVADHICANDHLKKEFPQIKIGLLAFCPGVKGQTGMETGETIEAILNKTAPDLLLVIDSLAAREVKRLGSTIQLSNEGIIPGSGVGNHQKALTRENLGIPVISIGVPMVIGSSVIAAQIIEAFTDIMEEMQQTKSVSQVIKQFEEREKIGLIREILPGEASSLYVMPQDADEKVEAFAQVIADSIMLISAPGLA